VGVALVKWGRGQVKKELGSRINQKIGFQVLPVQFWHHASMFYHILWIEGSSGSVSLLLVTPHLTPYPLCVVMDTKQVVPYSKWHTVSSATQILLGT
jgi:hypothetical protein